MEPISALDRHRFWLPKLEHPVEEDRTCHYLDLLTFCFSRFEFSSEDSLTPIDGVLCSCLLMVPDLLLPLRSTDLLDALQVSVPQLPVLPIRDYRARSWRNDDLDFPLGRFLIHGGVIEGSVCSHSLDTMSYRIEESGKNLGIMNGTLGEFSGDDEASLHNREMKLLPALRSLPAMFSRRPFSLPEGLEARRESKRTWRAPRLRSLG